MAIKKQYLKNKPICKVTFSILAKEAKEASVVGDFNEWNPTKGGLSKLKNGTFKGTFELPATSTFEFRYLIDDTYANDAAADAYRWNDYAGTENAVLSV